MPARGYEFYLRVFNSNERGERVRYRVEHSMINSYPQAGILYSVYYIIILKTKISENFPNLCRRLDERFRKFSEDCPGFPKNF